MERTTGRLFFGGTEPLPKEEREPSTNVEEAGSAEGDVAAVARSHEESPLIIATNNAVPSGNDATVPKTEERGHGRRANGQKPVTLDYDSDDGRLLELKHQGYSNADVSKILMQEGRPYYEGKTLQGRFARLQRLTENAQDERLDDELSDWHVGEDEILIEAERECEIRFQAELEKLVDKKWKEVSNFVEVSLGHKKYTKKACKERWNAVQEGTALKPIELDSDQEGRRILREERLANNRKRREDAAAEVQRQIDAVQAEKRRKVDLKKERAAQKEAAKLAREKEHAETVRLREEKKASKASAAADKKEAADLWMMPVREERIRRELEERIYRNLTGKQLRRIRRHVDDMDNEDEDEDDSADSSSHDDDDDQGSEAYADSNADDEGETDPTGTLSLGIDRPFNSGVSRPSTGTSPPISTSRSISSSGKVTAKTLQNARSILTDAELDVLLFQRGLARRTSRETHPQTVARIAAADEALSGAQLKALLEKHFDRGKGNKAVLVQRLAEYDARSSAAGANGVKATDPEFKRGYVGYTGKFAGLLG